MSMLVRKADEGC